jgi:hypothetical protein
MTPMPTIAESAFSLTFGTPFLPKMSSYSPGASVANTMAWHLLKTRLQSLNDGVLGEAARSEVYACKYHSVYISAIVVEETEELR